MVFFITVVFAFVVLLSCFLVAYFGKKWNLEPLLALSSAGLLVIGFLHFLPHSFSNLELSETVSLLVLLGILFQGFSEIYIVPRLKFLDKLVENSKTPHHHHSHLLSASTVCSTVGCLAICSFFDGIRLFAGLNMEKSVAIVTSAGLFFHLLSEGVLVAILAISSNIKMKVTLLLVSFISGTLILGSFFAKNFMEYFNSHYLIALATGMLVYICFIHLIPVSLKEKNRHWFFFGLAFFIVSHYFFH